MARKSREKGKRGENEAAQFLREHGFTDSRRGQQYRGGPDSPDVFGVPGLHIEVKRTETLRLYDALEQSERDASGIEYPVVMHRRNRCKWVFILDAEDFAEIYQNHLRYLERLD